jgi:hypothetical protein
MGSMGAYLQIKTCVPGQIWDAQTRKDNMNANTVATVIAALGLITAWSWGWYSIGYKQGRVFQIEEDIRQNREWQEWMGKRGGK